jgi:hypothetical protein
LPRPCIMTLLNCAVWPVPAQGGNAETVLRPEKVLSKCFRTGVRLPSAPPSKGYEKDVPGRKPDFIGLFCCPKAVFRSFKIVDEKTAFSL